MKFIKAPCKDQKAMRHEEKNSSWRIFKFGSCPLCRWRRREKSCHFRRREKKDAKKQADKPEKALLDGSAARLQTLGIRWCRQNEMRSRIAVHLEMHAVTVLRQGLPSRSGMIMALCAGRHAGKDSGSTLFRPLAWSAGLYLSDAAEKDERIEMRG